MTAVRRDEQGDVPKSRITIFLIETLFAATWVIAAFLSLAHQLERRCDLLLGAAECLGGCRVPGTCVLAPVSAPVQTPVFAIRPKGPFFPIARAIGPGASAAKSVKGPVGRQFQRPDEATSQAAFPPPAIVDALATRLGRRFRRLGFCASLDGPR